MESGRRRQESISTKKASHEILAWQIKCQLGGSNNKDDRISLRNRLSNISLPFVPQHQWPAVLHLQIVNFHCSLMSHFLGILYLGPKATQTHLENHRSVSCVKLCHGFLTSSIYIIGKLLALLFKIRFHIDTLEAWFPLRATEQFLSTGK